MSDLRKIGAKIWVAIRFFVLLIVLPFLSSLAFEEKGYSLRLVGFWSVVLFLCI